MPTYDLTSSAGTMTVTSPDPLTPDQMDGIASGTLSIPGVTVDRGRETPAGPPSPPLPPRQKAFGGVGEIARPGESAGMDISDPRAWQGGKPPPMADPVLTMLKKQAPNIATDAVLGLVPGGGYLKSAGRAALATGAGAGTAALTGQDPMEQTVKSGISSMVGETIGGLARAASRWGQDAYSQTTKKMGTLIGDLIPAFKGPGPRETIDRAINGRGVAQLGEDYGHAVDDVIKRYGNPGVIIPAFEKLNLPSMLPASEVNLLLKSRGRALFDPSGNMKTGKGTLSEDYWLDQAREQFQNQLSAILPAKEAAGIVAARQDYARGKAIQRLLQEGKGTLTNDQIQSLLDKGRLNEPALEATFKRMQGKLADRFDPDEMAQMEAIIRRGARNPLALSPESPTASPRVSIGASLGAVPHPRPHFSLPHAPVRIGTPETVAEVMARLGRLLGAGGTQYMMNE
jgi:hypothetical protein